MKNGLDVDVKTLAEMKDLSEYVGADLTATSEIFITDKPLLIRFIRSED